MTSFEHLCQKADDSGIEIIMSPFQTERIKGLYCDKTIAINESLKTTAEKSCVLAEELGHHYTTVGNILNQKSAENRKQEMHARMWAYNRMIGLYGIISCYRAGCRNIHEMAEYLHVTEVFMIEALERYRQKYGKCVYFDNYAIYFEPNLQVLAIL